jgi:hypothetical protein
MHAVSTTEKSKLWQPCNLLFQPDSKRASMTPATPATPATSSLDRLAGSDSSMARPPVVMMQGQDERERFTRGAVAESFGISVQKH